MAATPVPAILATVEMESPALVKLYSDMGGRGGGGDCILYTA